MCKRRLYWILETPVTGSRWCRGNFTLGVMVDNHPRFFNLIFCCVFVEVGFGWEKP